MAVWVSTRKNTRLLSFIGFKAIYGGQGDILKSYCHLVPDLGELGYVGSCTLIELVNQVFVACGFDHGKPVYPVFSNPAEYSLSRC